LPIFSLWSAHRFNLAVTAVSELSNAKAIPCLGSAL
jgi:hypothetical protein